MSERTTTALTVSLDAASPEVGLTLEMHQGPYAEYGAIPVRLYPPVEAILRATRGSAHFGESRVEAVEEILSFDGGKTASLKRPLPQGIAFYSLQLALDAEGNDAVPTLHYDPATAEVVSDIPFYGAFKVVYTAPYRLIYYKYEADFEPFGGGLTLSAGTLYAFYGGASAHIDIGFSSSSDPFTVELYRVYSNIVLDPDGAWEEPPGWTEDGSYPDRPDIEPRDKDNAFTDERKHRVGYVNKLGTVSWQWFGASTLQPYTGFDFGKEGYRPKYKIRWADPPDKTWEKAFASVKKGEIQADLAKSFPGLT